jgi:transglutaminase-like putative cysteine protease
MSAALATRAASGWNLPHEIAMNAKRPGKTTGDEMPAAKLTVAKIAVAKITGATISVAKIKAAHSIVSPVRFGLALLLCLTLARASIAEPPRVEGAPSARSNQSAQPLAEPGEPDYSLEVRNTARVKGTLTCDVTYPDFKARDWVVFAAQAPELPGQIKTQTTLEPPGKPARDKSPLCRPLLMGRVRADADHAFGSLKIAVTYEATLRSRWLRRGSPRKVGDLKPEEREKYLAEAGFLDFSQPAFREWVEQHGLARGDKEGEIHFARRVFLALKSGIQYDSPPRNDFHATATCKNGKGDCGGLSVLFAAICRANRIPARTLWGRWAQSAKPGQTWHNHPFYQAHVKAEFFARGVGWVPVDLASAVLHDHSAQGLRFFGNDPGDFIVFHIDDNFDIDSVLFGRKPAGHMQSPRWWLKGKGTLKDVTQTVTWEVTWTLPD